MIDPLIEVLLYSLIAGGIIVIGVRLGKRVRRGRRKTMTKAKVPEEVEYLRTVGVEITTIKKGRRIVTARAKMKRGMLLLVIRVARMRSDVRYRAFFRDMRQLQKDGKLRYDENYSEPINPELGAPEWSQELDHLIAGAVRGQLVKVASGVNRIVIDRQTVMVLIIVGAIAGVIAANLNATMHFLPTTVIHWFPYLPKGIP